MLNKITVTISYDFNFEVARLEEMIVEFGLHWTKLYYISKSHKHWRLNWHQLTQRTEKSKLTNNCFPYSFLSKGYFCFPIFPCFPKQIKLGYDFVTKNLNNDKKNEWKILNIKTFINISFKIWQEILPEFFMSNEVHFADVYTM